MKARYAIAVKNRFEVLESENVSKWEVLKEAVVTTSMNLIPPVRRDRKQEWMKDEILTLMEERQRVRDRFRPVPRVKSGNQEEVQRNKRGMDK